MLVATVPANPFALTTLALVTVPVVTVAQLIVVPFVGTTISWATVTTGTVTSASVVSANGFAGTVATSTTTPAITISTSVTGVLKGNGTAISAAIAGTDYVTPTSTETLTNKTLGATTISGHLIPSADVTYDLGSGTYKFRDLYLSGSSIKLGGATLTASGSALAIPASSTLTTPIVTTNITTPSTSFDLLNTTATTINFAGAATTALKIGASNAPITAFAATATSTSTAASLGYLGMPQNTQLSAYPIVIGDAGKHIYASATMTATIPANASVAFPIGTTIAFIAAAGATLTIAITTDTMYLGGTGTTGSRTLAPYGMATAVKITATSWFINGTGLT